jgi:hypothetical protein
MPWRHVGSWGSAPHIFTSSTTCRRAGSFGPWKKTPQYVLGRKLVVPQMQSGCNGNKRNHCSCWKSNPCRNPQPSLSNDWTIQAPQLFIYMYVCVCVYIYIYVYEILLWLVLCSKMLSLSCGKIFLLIITFYFICSNIVLSLCNLLPLSACNEV